MPVELSEFALCSLESVKRQLNITDTSHDDLLTELINRATARIEGWTLRKLKQRSLTEIYDGPGTAFLRLREFPIVGQPAVYIDANRQFPESSRLRDSDFLIFRESGLLAFVGANRLIATWPKGLQNTKVVYTAGYDPVPDDLQYACIELVCGGFFRARQGAQGIISESAGGYSVSWIDGLPKEVVEILKRYRRV